MLEYFRFKQAFGAIMELQDFCPPKGCVVTTNSLKRGDHVLVVELQDDGSYRPIPGRVRINNGVGAIVDFPSTHETHAYLWGQDVIRLA